jgi:oxalate decarboxylase/phosphoglucose isomerase-like protein (cupin superfamily)
VQNAKMLLQQQKGAAAVSFQLSKENNGILPYDTSHIIVNVTTLPGL